MRPCHVNNPQDCNKNYGLCDLLTSEKESRRLQPTGNFWCSRSRSRNRKPFFAIVVVEGSSLCGLQRSQTRTAFFFLTTTTVILARQLRLVSSTNALAALHLSVMCRWDVPTVHAPATFLADDVKRGVGMSVVEGGCTYYDDIGREVRKDSAWLIVRPHIVCSSIVIWFQRTCVLFKLSHNDGLVDQASSQQRGLKA